MATHAVNGGAEHLLPETSGAVLSSAIKSPKNRKAHLLGMSCLRGNFGSFPSVKSEGIQAMHKRHEYDKVY